MILSLESSLPRGFELSVNEWIVGGFSGSERGTGRSREAVAEGGPGPLGNPENPRALRAPGTTSPSTRPPWLGREPGARSINCGVDFLGGLVVQRLMRPFAVVEPEIVTQSLPGLPWRFIAFQIDLLLFDPPPETLGEDVIQSPPFSIHADPNPLRDQ